MLTHINLASLIAYFMLQDITGIAIADTFTLTNVKGYIDEPTVKMTARSRIHCMVKCCELNCLAFSIGEDMKCRLTFEEHKSKIKMNSTSRLYTVS